MTDVQVKLKLAYYIFAVFFLVERRTILDKQFSFNKLFHLIQYFTAWYLFDGNYFHEFFVFSVNEPHICTFIVHWELIWMKAFRQKGALISKSCVHCEGFIFICFYHRSTDIDAIWIVTKEQCKHQLVDFPLLYQLQKIYELKLPWLRLAHEYRSSESSKIPFWKFSFSF